MENAFTPIKTLPLSNALGVSQKQWGSSRDTPLVCGCIAQKHHCSHSLYLQQAFQVILTQYMKYIQMT